VRDHFAATQIEWETEPDDLWAARIGPDADNLRAAQAFAAEHDLHSLQVDLAASSYRFFMQQNLIEEGLAGAERALAVSSEVPPLEAARLRVGVASLARYMGLHAKGEAALDVALPILRGSTDTQALALALLLRVWDQTFGISDTPSLLGELEAAIAKLPTCKTLAWALVAIGVNHWQSGERESGMTRAEAGLAMFDRLDNPPGLFRAAINLAEALHHGGDTRQAIALAERYIPRVRMAGASVWLGMVASNLATYYLTLGEFEAARAPYAEAWASAPHDGGFWHASLLSPAAELALACGRPDAAALLIGFFDNYVEVSDDPMQSTEARLLARVTERLASIYTPQELDRRRREGRSLSFFEVDHLVESAVITPQLDKDGSRR
jgi:tetratricopeptide (TPR) repeat protein